MCERIIYNLDSNGYLQGRLEDLLGLEATKEDHALAERALAVVQKLDPPGVAARNLQECLLLQLTPGMPLFEQLQTLITAHLEDIEHNRLPVISRRTGFSIELIQQALTELRKLNPKPGADYNNVPVPPVTPDVFVELGDDGKYQVRLEDGRTPSLFISPYYRKLFAAGQVNDETREYIKRKINSAQWLIDSIQQRRNTLTRVAQAIVDHQTEFLSKGPEAIEPLKMQQIADKVGRARDHRQPGGGRQVDPDAAGHLPAEAVLLRRHRQRRRRGGGLGHDPFEASGTDRQRGQAAPQERRPVGQGSRRGRSDRGPPHGDEVSQGDEYSQFAAAPRLERNRRAAAGRRQGRVSRKSCSLIPAASSFGLKVFRHALHLPLAVDDGQRHIADGQQFFLPEQPVLVLDLGRRDADDRRPQPQDVVIPGRAVEAAFGPHHHDQHAPLFHLPVIPARRPEELGSPDLKIGKVEGMVQETHRVGFLVADAEFDFVFSQHGWGPEA